MITQALRSLVFYVLYLGHTAILALILGTHAIVVRRRTNRIEEEVLLCRHGRATAGYSPSAA